ncbi:MAG: ATP-binding protein [candidate division KSB1 bacterium]|nr:ATP-binding protein [candidate division KSB1 bacterium]MDZ7335521.1 ATP-binding protein [candidate division KSB1 bacterium]MDZ7357098.1 ATP-binding protein [candidate division KSB1 bacterium]MDZ7376833.1 ATP-binding protein [candidate division KSB1 bacterium]MDZ7401778.1 ATP-binding protein [candidate division KSB1 bacterium]
MNKLSRLKTIQPGYIIIISLLLISTLFLSALIELRQTRREIQHIMEEEASTLMEAISVSGANAIYSYLEIEKLAEDKLFTVARLVNRLEKENLLSRKLLQNIAADNEVHQIDIFNSQAELLLSSSVDSPTLLRINKESLEPIFQGELSELALGMSGDEQQHFSVAVKRDRGGAIVASLDAQEIVEFRKTIGVGKLMQDISEYPGIEYIVLQDSDGIILASPGISRMKSIESDSFLTRAFNQDQISSRLTQVNNQKIFEFVRPFVLDGETLGLFRIGLKTDHLDQANDRIQRRMIIMSLVLGLIVLIAVNFLTINQNYRIIDQAYRRIQTYSSNILEHMTDAVIAIDRDKRITLFNHAASQLFGQSAEEVMNKPCQLCVTGDIAPLVEAIEQGKTCRDVERVIQFNGRRLITLISTSVLKNQNGEIDSAFAVIKDLTEQRNLEEAVRRKEKLTAMGQLASGVAHEIRNPLNAIGMISQRLAKEFEPKGDAQEYRELIDTVVNEVRRINEIIQQFLRFARPPALDLKRIDLASLIQSVVKLTSAQAQEKGVEFHLQLDALPDIMIDANQMKQALLNVIQNSIEAIQDKGLIEIHLKQIDDREALIEITDNGIGMSQETLSKIFNLYFTTKPSGTGLGLSLVHQIISQHDGRIKVESEIGKGTRFLIYLPIN